MKKKEKEKCTWRCEASRKTKTHPKRNKARELTVLNIRFRGETIVGSMV